MSDRYGIKLIDLVSRKANLAQRHFIKHNVKFHKIQNRKQGKHWTETGEHSRRNMQKHHGKRLGN